MAVNSALSDHALRRIRKIRDVLSQNGREFQRDKPVGPEAGSHPTPTESNKRALGSAALIHSLVPHDLIDEYRLAIHPLVLGGGVRLFPDDGMLYRLQLVESISNTKGVILATYRPVREAKDQ